MYEALPPKIARRWGVRAIARYFIVLCLFLFLMSPIYSFYDWLNRASTEKIRAAKKAEEQRKTTPNYFGQYWVARWTKLPLFKKGEEGESYSGWYYARILKYDTMDFQFVVYGKGTNIHGYFNWNRAKNPHFGEWSQPDPPGKGTWYLSAINTELFAGSIGDEDGHESVFLLEPAEVVKRHRQ
ncbi:MAG: hypothetical protein HYT43_02170 [Candidatus Taylorbacteria bacterium]|nr:hypothetical protein [Candidatus Taylorbacteria bacterium]